MAKTAKEFPLGEIAVDIVRPARPKFSSSSFCKSGGTRDKCGSGMVASLVTLSFYGLASDAWHTTDFEDTPLRGVITFPSFTYLARTRLLSRMGNARVG